MDARLTHWLFAAALLAIPSLTGCGLTAAMTSVSAVSATADEAEPNSESPPTAATQSEPVHIAYRLDAGQIGLPIAVSCVEARQVSYEEVPANPLTGRSLGVLDIRYPHPAGKPDTALVGVVIQRQQEPNRGMPPGWFKHVRGWFRRKPADELGISTTRDLHEAWVLEIPKSEVDELLAKLKAAGFHDEAERDTQAVELVLETGDLELHKNWTRVPELDALMHRARSQGQLVSYQGVFEGSSR